MVMLGLMAALWSSGCGADTSGLQGRVQDLEHRVDSLSTQLAFQRLRLSGLESQGQSVTFDPITSEGYDVLQGPLAAFALSIEDVRAFANGTRLVLQVGNTSSVTFNGADFSVTYGPSSPMDTDAEDWLERYDAWREGLMRAELTTSATLSPGVWNEVHLNLPGIEPSALGHLRLEISTNRIRLRGPL